MVAPDEALLARAQQGELLMSIADGVCCETGETFFQNLVERLARTLDVRYAFVSELTRGGTHFRSRAFWERGRLAPNFEVPLEGTPCQGVLCGEDAFYPKGLQQCFPRDGVLVDWRAESYGGVPMVDHSGSVVGHFAFVHDQPLGDVDVVLSVMRIFAKRAVVEIERQVADDARREAEARLAGIVTGAADAILTFDADGRIELANPSAARALRCGVVELVGRSLWDFATEEGASALRAALRRLAEAPDARVFAGEEEVLVARRANGEPFALESSVSRSDGNGRSLYTLIFRDVEDRREVEREIARLRTQTEMLREEIDAMHGFEEIVGRSPALQRSLAQLDLVAGTDATVLIRGETGTGKELVARALHARSGRASRPLVKVNCAAIPAGLVESELFGHEKGAFTGATERRIGRFELAQQGTIFLDEVGELPPEAQVKLLRVLQEREFERVGGQTTQKADVRVIAATNRDLEKAIAEGRFREDLFYRLNVFPLQLPALRERAEDVPLLAHFFVARHAPRIGRRATGVSKAALSRLSEYAWPGNVRELENVIERALILSPAAAGEIGSGVLDAVLADTRASRAPASAAAPAAGREPASAAETPTATLEQVERQHIEATLDACGWRVEGAGGAAERLGLAPSTLRSRLQRFGIRRG
jgi:PAS domain S-box-containing protein